MPTDLRKAREVFLHAVGKLPPEQWDGYVAEVCGGDADLEQQVGCLLQVHREIGNFLDVPAPGLDATVDRPLPERPGTVIGPYKLLEQIGEGGMGVVFMAEQTRHCQEMLRRFGETNDPTIAERTAKICLLIPVASADLSPRVRLAERAVTGTEKHDYYRYFLLARALAHYRAGEFDRAVALLDKSFAGGARFFDPKPADLVLAMAHHQLGQREEAEKALKKARALIEQREFPKEDSGDYGSNWHDWVICQLLRREAETLIRGAKEKGSAISTH